MRACKWAMGMVAAALVAAAGLGRAADDETYDLRGPAPKKDQVYVSKGSFTIKEAEMTVKFAGISKSGTISSVTKAEEEAKVLAVDGRNVTKCRNKIVKESTDIEIEIDGNKMKHTEPGLLEGETVISERGDNGKWKNVLLDTKPTEKQKKGLDNRNGLENDDDLYPKDKVKVGHTWTVEAAALEKMLGSSFTSLKGKLNQKFVKIEDVGQEKCAVVESTGKISGKAKDDGDLTGDVELELKVTTWKSLETGVAVKEKFTGKAKDDGDLTGDVELALKFTTWRSLKTGATVREKYEGTIKLVGTSNADGVKADATLTGSLSGETATKLK